MSRGPSRAVNAVTDMAVASSNVRLAGFSANASPRAHTYPTEPPKVHSDKSPIARSPDRYCFAYQPTALALPATSIPSIPFPSLSSPVIIGQSGTAPRLIPNNSSIQGTGAIIQPHVVAYPLAPQGGHSDRVDLSQGGSGLHGLYDSSHPIPPAQWTSPGPQIWSRLVHDHAGHRGLPGH